VILSNFFEALRVRNLVTPTWTRPELLSGYSLATASGQKVTPESSKQVASAYRCANIISDDVAKMPLQQFISRRPGELERVRPNAITRNMAYVVEVQPNRQQTPFIFKKTAILWLLFWGNAYIWLPPGREREMFILPANSTRPYNEKDGSIWYEANLPDGTKRLPAVEVLHLMINSINGLTGRSVITYARETLGRRQAAGQTQNLFYSQGLMPSAIAWFKGEMNKDARKKVREAYSEAMAGTDNAGRLAVLDSKVERFDIVQMQPKDAQFLESIEATDSDIANFFGMPLYKLNLGKQSYESNEQQNLDYLSTTLDPYLVQWEQAAQLKWLTAAEQAYSYWRFERNALLRTNAKDRAEYLQKQILSGQLTPNQACQIQDLPSYEGGDNHFIPSNMAVIDQDGKITAISASHAGADGEGKGG